MRERDPLEVFPKNTKKSYGLMELMKGKTPSVGHGPEKTVFSWPHLFIREIILVLIVVSLLLLAAVFINAPLEEPANAHHPPNPAKAPWYLLGLQELVSYSALLGGIVFPGLVVIGLILIPYIDRKKVGIGIWFAKERRLANTLFLIFWVIMIFLIIIGVWFRGENWDFVFPW